MSTLTRDEVAALVAVLTLEEKVSLLTGRDSWSLQALPRIGLRSIAVSDGPSGVRGTVWDERFPSLNLPSATALSSSWDVDLAEEYGAVAAAEARAKEVDVVLGPTINLHRSPLGGRHFEAYSEDPLLTAELAAAYVAGVQASGVAATPKHYVGNDFETERFSVDVQIGERALRELYLLAFEKAVSEAGAWAVMSAYNSVNGTTGTESPLLTTPLSTEWGFDGVVISDWTAVRSLESARQSQDLAMPGPDGAWGAALVDAVRRGEVEQSAIDRKVGRILVLAARVGALAGHEQVEIEPVDGIAFARRAAAEGMVLVHNDGLLPLVTGQVTRVAVLGESARNARTQGGGSSEVMPGTVVSPLAGLREALPDRALIDYRTGAAGQLDFAVFEPASLRNPVTGEQGARVRYLDASGGELRAEDRFAAGLRDFGGETGVAGCAVVTFSTDFTPEVSGDIRIGFAHPGTGRLRVDGVLVLEGSIDAMGMDQIDAFFAPDSLTVEVPVTAGVARRLDYEFEPGEIVDGVEGSFTVFFGTQPAERDEDAMIREAVEAAAAADVAVVVVGTTPQIESEGFDRSDLRLPGRQDDLVAAVAAANPRTIVVVNAGGPVELPWRDDVAAVLLAWFPGQEFGHALADVLLGAVEPGGRLPTTWPARLADAPVSDVTPVDGRLSYDEGIHIGYRAWLRAGTQPAYPFGFGLGYTEWALGPLSAETALDGVTLAVQVTNSGPRRGKQVVQAYASLPGSGVDRPVRWLVGFGVVRLGPGETRVLTIWVPRRALAYWDAGWHMEAGGHEFRVGTSCVDLGDPVVVDLLGEDL